MKQFISMLLLGLFVLGACNDSNTTQSETTSSDSAGQAASDTGNSQSNTSANVASALMSAMTKHMDSMKNMQSMNDPDHDFAMMMKHHHQAAVDMAQLELSQGQDEGVKTMARKMIDDQTNEIQQFDRFFTKNQANNQANNQARNDKFHHEVMQTMNSMSMNMDHTGGMDQQFISMMIPHHQQAIDMAQIYLKHGKTQELKSLANKIISAQQKEIKEMKDWQAQNTRS